MNIKVEGNFDEAFAKKLRFELKGKVKLGGDPEFFIQDSNGKTLPSDKFFPGKDKPLYVFNNREEKLFFDGIQAEINPEPNECRELLIGSIRNLLDLAKSIIPVDTKIVCEPSVEVTQKVLNSADPEARIFGCMPDFNAYTLTTNTPPMDASKHMFRYAGGHIHLGTHNPYILKNSYDHKFLFEPENHIRLIKFLDVIVGVVSVVLDNSAAAKRRRSKYGKAGCFRPTPHGIEYRTPSCWWLKSPALTSLVFGLARIAWKITYSNMDEEFRKITGADDDTVRQICDESDVENAKKLLDKMLPYITVTDTPNANPIHISNTFRFGANGPYRFSSGITSKNICDKDRSYSKYANKVSRKVLSNIAFKYILDNGIESITGSIDDEWFMYGYKSGFVMASLGKLCNDKQFSAYQRINMKTFNEGVL